MTGYFITPRSGNVKTGDIPQVWIGGSVEESKASCDAANCALRPWVRGKDAMSCYAWSGSSKMGFFSAIKANPVSPEFTEVLKRRHPQAQAIRVGAIGDPCVMPWGWWYNLKRVAKRLGLQVLSYTHGWAKRPDLAGRTMASCDSFEEAVEARKLGFQAAIATREVGVLDKNIRLPDGSKAIVCPAMVAQAVGKAAVTCNQCLKCDGSNPSVSIVFPDHGPGARGPRKVTQ
jgi:hypothetical protein